MRQGEIVDDLAWFGFTLEQLFWLIDYIPATDGFRDEVQEAIKKFDEQVTPQEVEG